MKKSSNQTVQIIVAVVFLVIAGFLIITQLTPHRASSSTKGTTVEKITPIPDSISQDAIVTLTQKSNVKDYYTAPDLTTGLGVPSPFGQ